MSTAPSSRGRLATKLATTRATIIVSVALSAIGCHRAHFTVQSAPPRPEDLGAFRTSAPEINAVVQIANVSVRTVDAQYPDREKETFRRHFAVAIPNMLQESIGRRQVFSEVRRAATPGSSADYLVSGDYDFFERLGTGGREWIPFYGTFGGRINEAWIRANLDLRVVDASTGAEVLHKSYPEEHRDRTSVYSRPFVGYLQADYMSAIASDVIAAIANARGRHGAMPVPSSHATPKMEPSSASAADRLQQLEDLRRRSLVSDAEYQQRRARILDSALGQ